MTGTPAVRRYDRTPVVTAVPMPRRQSVTPGGIAPGQLADLAVLSDDYFAVPDEAIKGIESVLTLVGGKVVYAAGPFAGLDPPPLPVSPGWSPLSTYGGYGGRAHAGSAHLSACHAGRGCAPGCHLHGVMDALSARFGELFGQQVWGLGCDCFAF